MLTDHVQHATHWNFLGGINIYCFQFIYKEDKLFDFLKIMVWKDDILYEYVLAIYRCNSLYESVKEPIRIGQELFTPMRKFYWVVAWVSVFWSTLTNAFFNSQMEMSHKDSTGNNTSLIQNKNWEIKRDKPDEFKKNILECNVYVRYRLWILFNLNKYYNCANNIRKLVHSLSGFCIVCWNNKVKNTAASSTSAREYFLNFRITDQASALWNKLKNG